MKLSLLVAVVLLLVATGTLSRTSVQDGTIRTILASDPHVAVMGRSRDLAHGAREVGYPGVSFFLAVRGRRLAMTASSNTGHGWVDVSVDGSKARPMELGKAPAAHELFSFAVAGTHHVRVTVRTEAWQAISTIRGFTLQGGDWLPAPALPTRKILLLGDSVTCGEIIDRVPGEQRRPRWNDPLASYGMLAAAAVHARIQLVCYGGRGLVRSWDGRTDQLNLPDFYPLAVPVAGQANRWDRNKYTPDLVISAIGTNDFSVGIPDAAGYVDAYAALVRRILADYPHARIALTAGAILSGAKKQALVDDIAATVRVLHDPRVQQITSRHYPGDAQNAHPTLAQHRAMANDLVPQLREMMGW